MAPFALAGAIGLANASALAGCRVGQPGAPPGLVITESPPDCCYGSWAGSVGGLVTGVDTDSVSVALYAQTDLYYLQPFLHTTLAVGCDGAFRDRTRGGRRYAALLVRRGFKPPVMLESLPLVGHDVLAVAWAPDAPRRIRFANHDWFVKSGCNGQLGPGPNYWSDTSENAWVDSAGKLHLRLTSRGGRWYAAEVYTEEFLGYGRYRFEVQSRVDRLDPNVVFAGFFYSDQGDEADIEFSRWGVPGRRQNAQFVVQPQPPHEFVLNQSSARSLHEFDWQPQRINFASHSGGLVKPAASFASWGYTGPVPQPNVERTHFNLWLYRGTPPRNGREVEIVVSGFEFMAPGANLARTEMASPAPQVDSALFALAGPYPNPSRGPIACSLTLARDARVALHVFDVRGRMVQSTAPTCLAAGVHEISWDPTSVSLPLAAGIYYLRVDAGAAHSLRRVTLLR